jgi:hypothetical protein
VGLRKSILEHLVNSILQKFVLNLNYGILKARTYGIYLDFEGAKIKNGNVE